MVVNKLLVSFSDLDGALLSGSDGDRTVNTNLLTEACSGQDTGDAGRYSKIFSKNISKDQKAVGCWCTLLPKSTLGSLLLVCSCFHLETSLRLVTVVMTLGTW